MISQWDALGSPPDLKEKTRRLIDLFLVSVLLDAGAGNNRREDRTGDASKL